MKFIKLEKRGDGKDVTFHPNQGDMPLFKHCCPDGYLTKYSLDYYQPIFEAHNVQLLIPHTLERGAKIIYRVDDGVKFIKNEDGQYKHELLCKDSIGCDFERFDPYNFTTNKEEL